MDAEAKVVVITLELPYPPTVNKYWVRTRNGRRTCVGQKGLAFRANVEAVVWSEGIKPLDGSLAVEVWVYPPDQRRRDVDNVFKALLDALQHAGAYHDDNQISRLTIQRCEPVTGGRAIVQIQQITQEN